MNRVPVVRSLTDAFSWPEHFISALTTFSGSNVLQALYHALSNSSFSSAFSGIGCFEESGHVVAAHCHYLFGIHDADIPAPQSLFAVELDSQCRTELQLLPGGGPECMYDDMLGFVGERLFIQKI